MEFIRIEDYTKLQENDEVIELLKEAMYMPTDGRVKTLIEGMYSRNRNYFYEIQEDGELIGILGHSHFHSGECEIHHLSFIDKTEEKQLEQLTKVVEFIGKYEKVIKIVLYLEDGTNNLVYREVGFKIKRVFDKVTDLSKLRCQLRV